MKNLILGAAILALAGVSTVKASEVTNPVANIAQQDSTTKTPVKIEELPDAVKATLSGDQYKDWAPIGAFKITEANKPTYYQVDAKKGEETASIKIGEDGVVIQ